MAARASGGSFKAASNNNLVASAPMAEVYQEQWQQESLSYRLMIQLASHRNGARNQFSQQSLKRFLKPFSSLDAQFIDQHSK